MPLDVQKLVDGIHDYIGRALSPVAARLKALEDRAPIPGQKGDPGERGERGADGAAGKDGADGKDGAPGRDGVDGLPGKNGENGAAGKDGSNGIDGKDGAPGRDGDAGLRGEKGDAGHDGRDALQIDILPAIDPTKAYPRGTFARWRGGLVRTFRDSAPMDGAELERSGWEVIVEGLAGLTSTADPDGRSFEIKLVATSGAENALKFKVATALYRGVWKHDEIYERGDMTTWDGSTWHCESESTKAQPGTSPDWKLAVKRGMNGKDGKTGK